MIGAAKRKRLFATPGAIRTHGLLGINARNAEWLLPANPRRFYPRVDDKLVTKALCAAAGIPVPETFGVIRRYGDLRHFRKITDSLPGFVVKPAEGSGGRGIVVVLERQDGTYRTAARGTCSLDEIRHHVSSILSGLYSLGGRTDKALIERRILPHDIFESIARGGTPDIRIVVYAGIPVMAMLRLPTSTSGGKANLHQGAVGAGVNILDGVTRSGVMKNRAVDTHPDTGGRIAGVHIPSWEILMRHAATLCDVLELGYFGADFVLDRETGPILLEANARPGLAIQIANNCGLLRRLAYAADRAGEADTVERRLDIARQAGTIF